MILQNIPVKEWGLSTSTANVLLQAGIHNYVDFIKTYLATDRPLKRTTGIGNARVWEIEGRMDDLGLRYILTTEEKLLLSLVRPCKKAQLAVELIAKTENAKKQMCALDSALDQLSERERTALKSRFTNRTIAAFALDCSMHQVCELEYDARCKVRQLMGLPTKKESLIRIETLDLSPRVCNVLKRNSIDTVEDIMSVNFADIYGLGACAEKEVIDKISKLGYIKEPVLHY